MRHGVSTSAGSTSTLIDAYREEADDFFNNGTIFSLSGDLLENQPSCAITTWILTPSRLTRKTATAASGIRYAIWTGHTQKYDLIAAVNDALSELSPIPMIYEDAEFVTVADQESYELPEGIYNIKKVFIAASETDPTSGRFITDGWKTKVI